MLKIAIADLREHLGVWAGVLLVGLAVAFCVMACVSFAAAVIAAPASAFGSGGVATQDGYLTFAINLVVFSCLPGIVVLDIVLGNVAQQTAGSHALWRLGGASPRQVVAMIVVQAVGINLVAALGGALLTIPLQPQINARLLDAGTTSEVSLPGGISVPGLIGTVGVVALVAIISAILPATRAARVSPTVVRTAVDRSVGTRKRLLAPLIFFVLVVLPLSSTLLAVPVLESAVYAVIATMPLGQVLAVQLALLTPWLAPPLLRTWTRLVPSRFTSWHVARHLALERVSTSSAVVAPMMLAAALFASMLAVTTTASNVAPSGASVNSYEAVLVSVPIGILGTIGSIAIVAMASRMRIRDLVSLRSAGAARRDTDLVVGLEAVISVVTAALLAAFALSIQVALLIYALAAQGESVRQVGFSLGASVIVLGCGFVGSLVSSLASARIVWRRPLSEFVTEG